MKTDQVITLIQVFECDLSDLMASCASEFDSITTELYAKIVKSSLSGDVAELKKLVARAKDLRALNFDHEILFLLSELRLQCRVHEVSLELAEQLLVLAKLPSVWKSEIQIIAAQAFDYLGQNERCRDLNLAASRGFAKLGAPRKSVRALANSIAAESRIEPDRHCIPDLLELHRRARKVGERPTAALTLTHLSREYQKLGAHQLSLNYASKAVAIGRQLGGSHAHYYSLAHRCQVFAMMGMRVEARLDYQACLSAQFAVIQSSLEILTREFPYLGEGTLVPVQENCKKSKATIDFWKDRPGEAKIQGLTKLEEKLLARIAEAPRSKQELIHFLYGEKIDERSAFGRLFTLLGRLKKRHPHLVMLVQGKYRLAEMSASEQDISRRVISGD